MRIADIVLAILFLLFSLFYYFYLIPTQLVSSVVVSEFAGRIFRPDTFPRMAIILFAFLSALLLVNALFHRTESAYPLGMDGRALFQALFVYAVGYGYVLALEQFGFLLTSPFFLAILITFLGTRDWRYVIPISLLVPLSVHYFFWYSFQVILPEGEMF